MFCKLLRTPPLFHPWLYPQFLERSTAYWLADWCISSFLSGPIEALFPRPTVRGKHTPPFSHCWGSVSSEDHCIDISKEMLPHFFLTPLSLSNFFCELKGAGKLRVIKLVLNHYLFTFSFGGLTLLCNVAVIGTYCSGILVKTETRWPPFLYPVTVV